MKVKVNSILVGVSKAQDEENSQSNLDRVLSMVGFQFGNRPVVVLNKDRIVVGIKYPACFAAGWFYGAGKTDPNIISELIVVGHGDNFEDAQRNLMNGVKNVSWEEDAGEIDVVKAGFIFENKLELS